jgi:WD40 repeat protein
VEPLPEGGLRVWNLQSRESAELGGRELRQRWTAISPDGSALLAGGRDSALWWNLRSTAEPPLRLETKGALFSQNGAVLVTLHDRSFKVWDPGTRSVKAEFGVEADFALTTALSLAAALSPCRK